MWQKSTQYRRKNEFNTPPPKPRAEGSIPSAPAIQILQHKKCCNKPIRNSHSIISALRMNKASGITSRRFYFSLNKKSPALKREREKIFTSP
nr:MAG TPA: hypothetical protein [Caudoviricetes sp.]